MPIVSIERDSCDGCGICIDNCPNDVIRLDEKGKAVIVYPRDCDTCFLCETNCPLHIIMVSAEIPDTPTPF